MVRHHVAQGACAVVEPAAGLDAHRFRGGDLDVTDMVSVPKRLEDAVGEAQHQDVLNAFLAEEMIDPINLVLAQSSQDLRIERLRRGQVVAERLFDDHAAPGAVRLAGQFRATEMLDDGREELVGHGQVEQHVATALFGASLCEQGLQPAVDLGLGEIPRQEQHASREPVPGRLIDAIGLELSAAIDSERLHHLPQAAAPGLRVDVSTADTDDREAIGQPSGPHKIVERGHDETFGQVATSPEYHEGRRWGLPVGARPPHSCCGCLRYAGR